MRSLTMRIRCSSLENSAGFPSSSALTSGAGASAIETSSAGGAATSAAFFFEGIFAMSLTLCDSAQGSRDAINS